MALLAFAQMIIAASSLAGGLAQDQWLLTGARAVQGLGGMLTDVFGWPSVFYVNVLLAGGAMFVAFAVLPDDRPAGTGSFDLPGALTGTLASTLLVFALVQGPEAGWAPSQVLIPLAVASAMLLLFVVIERRSAAPMVPLWLFANRNLSTGASSRSSSWRPSAPSPTS